MNRKLFAIAFCLVLLGGIAVPSAKADTGNEEMTFIVKNGPIELPGRVLQPGRYDMKFIDLEHHVVLVTKADGSAPIGFFDVVPISRARLKDNAQLQLSKSAKAAPDRLRDFFYPDLHTGYKFMYPNSGAHAYKLPRIQ